MTNSDKKHLHIKKIVIRVIIAISIIGVIWLACYILYQFSLSGDKYTFIEGITMFIMFVLILMVFGYFVFGILYVICYIAFPSFRIKKNPFANCPQYDISDMD